MPATGWAAAKSDSLPKDVVAAPEDRDVTFLPMTMSHAARRQSLCQTAPLNQQFRKNRLVGGSDFSGVGAQAAFVE